MLVTALAMGVASWLLWGLSFAALTFALGPYGQGEWLPLAPLLVTAFAVGYAIGILSIMTPSGLGVREGAYYLLLVPVVDGGTVALAALAMRLWIVLGEVVMAGAAALVVREDDRQRLELPDARAYSSAFVAPVSSAPKTPTE
jgi:uncharacterized membrane protein YbhN (UPF0104 family)